jgi:hypothetical protein
MKAGLVLIAQPDIEGQIRAGKPGVVYVSSPIAVVLVDWLDRCAVESECQVPQQEVSESIAWRT